MAALEEHLKELFERKARMEALIRTVEKTIADWKGEESMRDRERFEAFKQRTVEEKEAQYGDEARKRFGDAEIDASNQKMLAMSEEEWERFRKLEEEICVRLEEGVRRGMRPEEEAAKEIVKMHRAWLCMTWSAYSENAHRGLAEAYVLDERFLSYYDREVDGCAVLLRDAILFWTNADGE